MQIVNGVLTCDQVGVVHCHPHRPRRTRCCRWCAARASRSCATRSPAELHGGGGIGGIHAHEGGDIDTVSHSNGGGFLSPIKYFGFPSPLGIGALRKALRELGTANDSEDVSPHSVSYKFSYGLGHHFTFRLPINSDGNLVTT